MAGTTLVETMCALILFVVVAVGISASLIQIRKMSENDMSQTVAQTVAEGIIEQIQRMSFADLSDTTANVASMPDDFPNDNNHEANWCCVPLKFIGVANDNHAAVQNFSLYWATNTTATPFTQIGEREDPNVLTSAIRGIVLDVEFQDSAGVLIRPRRYMKMGVNLARSIDSSGSMVAITLKYQWEVPNKKASNGIDPVYLTREIRFVKSNMPTY